MRRATVSYWFKVSACAVLLISCNTIQGDRKLLVDEPTGVHSPAWSADGSGIYYIKGRINANLPENEGCIWLMDLSTRTSSQISDEEFWDFEPSPSGKLAVTMEGWWFWVWDTKTWNKVDSCQPCQDALDHWSDILGLKFSYESDKILYYSYRVEDTIFLMRKNLQDYIDTALLTRIGGPYFDPGPGDSLVDLWDTIYNLNTGERIPVGVEPQYLDWNQANPNELLICTWDDRDVFLFNIERRKLYRIDCSAPGTYNTCEAKFSPDGEKIVYAVKRWDDGLTQIWLLEFSDQ